ncbi:MAG: 2-succinyl-5-enolpyruvyl-6-hydroxy-3-cyclohexene-1-carboxylic-acid synthase [Sphingomonadales bacterium]
MSHLRHNLDAFAHAFKALGIHHIVVSPGSRNAPIVAGFIRVGGFSMLSAPDERAAAFMALGSAQATGKPAVVICTSGTAVLNLYPGICEAYYQRIPIIAISADRPENLIDQWDGQTIHQKDIFEKHILQSFHLTADVHESQAEKELLSHAAIAAAVSTGKPCGPVHINIPLKEPIYADLDSSIETSFASPELPKENSHQKISIPAEWLDAGKILILVGQNKPDENLRNVLRSVSQVFPVLTDVLSNAQSEHTIGCTENMDMLSDVHRPEILITMGMGVVSKNLKMQLRNLDITSHFHLGDGGFTGDPFFTRPVTLQADAAAVLADWMEQYRGAVDSYFLRAWKTVCNELYNQDTESAIVRSILKNIPEAACLQLGNSMVVRYANGCAKLPNIVFGNRGTSGIDGSVSTAMGYAWANPEKQVYCITGDIGFLYDKNAWWCNPLPKNILVIIINNRGGLIFDRLQGPEKLPELRNFVHTPHHLDAKAIAEHYNVLYSSCNGADFDGSMLSFTGILEIFTA